jgi:conjugative transfer signal peptidase TraF
MDEPRNGRCRLLRTAEAAALLDLGRSTLEHMRVTGASPPFKRRGGRCIYRFSELDAWRAARKRHATRRSIIRWLLVAAIIALALLVTVRGLKRPLLIWNASPSVPVGLYRVAYRFSPGLRDLVLVRLPEHIAHLATRRGYLPRSTYLVKPVAAIAGDRVCRFGAQIFVRHRLTVQTRARDWLGRPLPAWQGCRTLGAGQLFLLADHPDSFDSRYFGSIDAGQLIGIAILLWPARTI